MIDKSKAGYVFWEDDLLVAYDKDGRPEVVGERGTDADFDNHAVEVQNGDGYYNEAGRFVRYKNCD